MVDTNILLVDDEKDGCASMSDVFLDLGYTVDVAPMTAQVPWNCLGGTSTVWSSSITRCPAWMAWNSAGA
jgi:hypothetical protein